MAHHNSTPQSVLDAPSRSCVVTIPTGYSDRAGRRLSARAARSKARQSERPVSRLTVLTERTERYRASISETVLKHLRGESPERVRAAREKREAREAKQAEFRARQAASVWPDGNRRTLSKTARATR